MTPEQAAAATAMEQRLGKMFCDLSRAEVDVLFGGCIFWYMGRGMTAAGLMAWIEAFYTMNADLLKALRSEEVVAEKPIVRPATEEEQREALDRVEKEWRERHRKKSQGELS